MGWSLGGLLVSNKGLCMKRIGLNYTLVLIAVSFFVGRVAIAGSTPGFVKTQREDFGQMIKDGVESEKQLREELRKQVGLSYLDEEAKAPNANKKAILLKGPTEQIAVPSSGAITTVKRVKLPTYSELSQERVSQEVEGFQH